MLDITVLVITKNEEVNLPYLLENVSGWAKDIVILDSGSTDNTVKIAQSYGARIYTREFDNFSSQRNHLLSLDLSTEWSLVLDADEYLTDDLKIEIEQNINSEEYDGFYLKRRFYWMGTWIKRGYYPTVLMRLARTGMLSCDSREINEHLVCKSTRTNILKHDFIDYNRKSLSDWLIKHNDYSSREAKALFTDKNENYDFFGGQYQRKRWIRVNVWNNLPPIIRPILFVFYRVFFKLGFLDGKKALLYHFLHAFIYRAIIDSKYLEIKWKEK
ncbi:glycosyltransferase family 2 protein [Vibrio fluvialis]|nr:glycosyltransferase family 2 protein [Vibrio fluvialis]